MNVHDKSNEQNGKLNKEENEATIQCVLDCTV